MANDPQSINIKNTLPSKQEILMLLITEECLGYLPNAKALFGNAKVFPVSKAVGTLVEITTACKKRGITGVVCTQVEILKKLLSAKGNDSRKQPSLSNYQGSYFLHDGIEFVFISPLKQLQTVNYGSFIAKRFISKLVHPAAWAKVPKFSFEMLTEKNYEEIFQKYQSAVAIAVDIETTRELLRIKCIGYTALFIDRKTGVITTHSCVLYIENLFHVSIMRKFNWDLKAPKVFQNGKYDLSYLARYNAVPYNYLWDTSNMFHCWYSELPKDLAFLGAFFVREAMYWKDLAETQDRNEYARYNALDTWTTILVFIAWIIESPQWAKNNYRAEFPVQFPCHLSEMTGVKRDMIELAKANKEVEFEINKDNESLSKMLGTWPQIFNVNSTPQNERLRRVLGCQDITSSDEKSLKKIALKHPLNSRICNKILDLRGNRKLQSTYLCVATPEDQRVAMKAKDIVEGKELNGRILYALNNDNTDTARLASKEHHFWLGLQIQNVPGGDSVKKTIICDEDFRIAENDLKQAETRDTAYVAGETNLMAAVNSSRDFHSVNASAFFGTPYEKIYSDKLCKTLDKVLRNLAKRVNHGANYLMGAMVLIDTMGEPAVWEAKRVLCLPRSYGLKQVAEHLLAVFHQTYPILSGQYYPAVVSEVTTTSMLQSHTNIRKPKVYDVEPVFASQEEWELEPLEGWTRYCFGNPAKNKLDKNALVAHVSQNLNAMKLNVAYLRVFYEIAINPKYYKHFKLCAQIHDSILYQFRVGHEYLMDMVREIMETPCRCLGYDGVIREYTVPADIKGGPDGLGAERWSETE